MIDQLHSEGVAATALCQTLGVNRSAYYAWRRHETGPRGEQDNRLRPLVREIFWEHRRRDGSRRIARELARRGKPCGCRRVARLMDEMDRQMKQALVLTALRNAIGARQPRRGLIHHSDRGGQYAGTQYRDILDRAGMLQSMSRATMSTITRSWNLVLELSKPNLK